MFVGFTPKTHVKETTELNGPTEQQSTAQAGNNTMPFIMDRD